jgi:hypothetical protein
VLVEAIKVRAESLRVLVLADVPSVGELTREKVRGATVHKAG